MIQQCPRSAHARDERHNAVAKLLTQKLVAPGHTVEAEPAIKTDHGVHRPDVVAYKPGERAVIVYVTIVAISWESSRTLMNGKSESTMTLRFVLRFLSVRE